MPPKSKKKIKRSKKSDSMAAGIDNDTTLIEERISTLNVDSTVAMHYQEYPFSWEVFAPSFDSLKTKTTHDSVHDREMRKAWESMRDAAYEIFECNLACPDCHNIPPDAHKDTSEDGLERKFTLSRYRNLKDIGLLTRRFLADASADFQAVEKAYLERDKVSECQGLRPLARNLEAVRKRVKNTPKTDATTTSLPIAANEDPQPNHQTDAGTQPESATSAQTPRLGAKDGSYSLYQLSPGRFSSIMAEEKDAEKRVERLNDAWFAMRREAIAIWEENLRCQFCYLEPTAVKKQNLSMKPRDIKHSYPTTIDLEQIFPLEYPYLPYDNGPTQEELDSIEDSLYAAEISYLESNVEALCQGLAVLKRRACRT